MTRTFAIIGAGISGLGCARALLERGVSAAALTLFDKARGPGGRMSSRRHAEPALSFDHGAQYFTAREPRFLEAVERWRDLGVVATWQGHFARLGPNGVEHELPRASRYVGTPRMSALTRHLAGDLSLHTQTRILRLEGSDRAWFLRDTDGLRHGPFTDVILTPPGPQAGPLLAHVAPSLAAAARALTYAPCWSLMLIPARRLKTDWDALRVTTHAPVLTWAARSSSKPGRDESDAWTLHAGHDWSRAHLEDRREVIEGHLLEAFSSLCGDPLDAPRHVQAMRWRYALASPPRGEARFRHDPALGLTLCGDGWSGGRVEDAWLSGVEAAAAIAD